MRNIVSLCSDLINYSVRHKDSNNFSMHYPTLFNKGSGGLQEHTSFYVTFNSLYVVDSTILLTHRCAVTKLLTNILIYAYEALCVALIGRKRKFIDFLFLSCIVRLCVYHSNNMDLQLVSNYPIDIIKIRVYWFS